MPALFSPLKQRQSSLNAQEKKRWMSLGLADLGPNLGVAVGWQSGQRVFLILAWAQLFGLGELE